MEQHVIDEILSELKTLSRYGHFKHVVGTELGLVQGFEAMGRPEDAVPHYENLRKYLAALDGLPEFREREFTVAIPRECMINISNQEYIERAYALLEGKSPE